ncbi:pre-mRNA-splicing factor cwc2-like [Aedes aegypti]|uniref:Uncharacterized protein n=1 Tax=Aedes aegypti TaxID=7159 RepID=A0A6I8U0J1_AEDAE|nr:pre-mRNA-splicing factor cwc2-like [Aedes aegypti]
MKQLGGKGKRSYVSYPKDDVKLQQRTSSNTTKSQAPYNSAKENENNHEDAPSAHPADGSSDDDDGDESDNDNDDDGNNSSSKVHENVTIELTGKRRLSTENSSGTTADNEPKRSCSQGSQKVDTRNDSDWKVHECTE